MDIVPKYGHVTVNEVFSKVESLYSIPRAAQILYFDGKAYVRSTLNCKNTANTLELILFVQLH